MTAPQTVDEWDEAQALERKRALGRGEIAMCAGLHVRDKLARALYLTGLRRYLIARGIRKPADAPLEVIARHTAEYGMVLNRMAAR